MTKFAENYFYGTKYIPDAKRITYRYVYVANKKRMHTKKSTISIVNE